MQEITFLNGDKDLEKRGRKHLESRLSDLKLFMKAEDLEDVEDLGSFYDYGLCEDYRVDEKSGEVYFYFQLSYGGPSDEIRIRRKEYSNNFLVEYVFLDWFEGVGFDVTDSEEIQWLVDWFKECDYLSMERFHSAFEELAEEEV